MSHSPSLRRMSLRPLAALAGLALATVSLSGSPRVAEACGGCFAPPSVVQSVTDHRMVLSVSATRTTLWDQFSYAGNPSDFSWILPIRSGPDVQVDLADDRFMSALDSTTAPRVFRPQLPRQNCPNDRSFSPTSAGAIDAGSPEDGGVVVHREEVVGPYAVAVIGGTNAMAIRTWLRDSGFSVPAAIEPVIDHYVALRSDFVALKLRAGVGLNRMSPVRVTIPSYAPTLPLRMVAAGVSDKVALNLLVIADTRFEATNFPNGEVRDSDLTWDWNTPGGQDPAADFRAVENAINVRNAGRAWITESALTMSAGAFRSIAQQAERSASSTPLCNNTDTDGGSPDADTDASADAGPGPSMRCVEPTPMADMEVALMGLSGAPTITRLHADLAGQLLDRDLQLAPAAVPAERPVQYNYGTIRNVPTPPPCAVVPVARPSVQPIRCTTVPVGSAGFGLSGAAFVLSALAAAARRRAKR
ncbi:MAG: DUF2330 domain-containing protein [Deltaproteobacteria bacterium]|nr:DUF2330 domain-containing protein [Deltaproteobacteria bacterium]